MDTIAPRVGAWLETIGDLLLEPLTTMPRDVICHQLAATFDVTAALQVASDEHGRQHFHCQPADAFRPLNQRMERWTSGGLAAGHAVLRWYQVTENAAPMTMGRVPTALVPRRAREPVVAPLRPLGLEQQLWILTRRRGPLQGGFAVGRASSDFSDEDLVVARYVQRALIGLEMQILIMQQFVRRAPAELELTGREQAVLGLICAGHATRTAAGQLGCSPRTIDKHLERIYRKLGVRDRVNAVRVAHLSGLIAMRTVPDERPTSEA